jgi:hypothetical protein
MGLLDDLRAQARAVRDDGSARAVNLNDRIEATEAAGLHILEYWSAVCPELATIEPAIQRPFEIEPDLIAQGLQAVDFRCDSRRKRIGERDCLDYIVVLYELVSPQSMRVMRSALEHDKTRRKLFEIGIEATEEAFRTEDQRLIRCEFAFETRIPCGVRLAFDHENQRVNVRLKNLQWPLVLQADFQVGELTQAWLEELTRHMIDQPSQFDVMRFGKLDGQAAGKPQSHVRPYGA